MKKKLRPLKTDLVARFTRLLTALLVAFLALSSLAGGALAAPGTKDEADSGVEIFTPEMSSAAAGQTSTPLPLGTVTIISGPTDCIGQTCYELKVTCPEVPKAANAFVKIGPPTGPTPMGTILFANGGTGVKFWADMGVEAARVVDELRATGYRTVQIRWKASWFQAAAGKRDGPLKLACRPATVERWVYDQIHAQDTTAPYCAYGHSNGASQVAYPITQYGLADIFSTVVLNGGPNWSRIDHACIQDDPAYQSLWYTIGERKTVDKAFGYPGTGVGPCSLKDPAFRDMFYQAGVVNDAWQYTYPNTMLAFLFGAKDNTRTANHGKFFHSTVVQAGTPLVRFDTVPNTAHNTFATAEGANAIRDVLVQECRIR